MSGMIYLVPEPDRLIAMPAERYNSEDVLQNLLAKYPDLLAGEQVNPTSPRRWLLVAREIGLPSDEAGVDRWSVDHLFLDQDGVPTIVEVKRSTDTRIRREVVGQMLDYAANAVVHWPVETLRARFSTGYENNGRDPEQVLQETFGADVDVEFFWQTVKTNLQAGRVRMVFVADDIPPELRRVIDFLNTQMDPAEVIGIEIKQFVGEGLQALVPRVVSQTKLTKSSGSTGERIQWDEELFRRHLRDYKGDEAGRVADHILGWTKERNLHVRWTTGKLQGAFYVDVEHHGVTQSPISVWTYGKVVIEFGALAGQGPFSDETLRRELLHRLNAIPGVQIGEDRLTKYPGIPLTTFTNSDALNEFLGVLDWVVGVLRGT